MLTSALEVREDIMGRPMAQDYSLIDETIKAVAKTGGTSLSISEDNYPNIQFTLLYGVLLKLGYTCRLYYLKSHQSRGYFLDIAWQE